MSPAERIKSEFIARAMKRAEEGRYPVIEPTAEDNRKNSQWWLRALDGKAFLLSVNGSAAWLFPHYELKLVQFGKRVIIGFGGKTIVDSNKCFEFHETAHPAQIYIPPTEVQFQYLFKTDTVTFCPYKGLAHYYGVRVREHEIADAFWTYDEPYERFPDNGNASDVLRLKGMLSPDKGKLEVTVRDDSR